MKKILPPSPPPGRVRYLSRRLVDHTSAKALWGQTSGHAGNFKEALTDDLLIKQNKRCAYCGTRIFGKRPPRDHIAPKSKYHKWTFWPTNLVLTCTPCNTEQKGEADTVSKIHRSYRRTEFSIVHPYFDNPEDHLNFIGHRGAILVKPRNGSEKGLNTIKMFDLMEPERAKQRAKDALFDRDVEHLHGKFKRLFEQFLLSPLPQSRALKMKK